MMNLDEEEPPLLVDTSKDQNAAPVEEVTARVPITIVTGLFSIYFAIIFY